MTTSPPRVVRRPPDRVPIRVLHVIHWPVSGIVSLLQNIVSSMPATDIETHFLFFEYAQTTQKWFQQTGYPIFFAGGGLLNCMRAYRRQVRVIRPDIVHTHSFMPLVLGALLCRDRIQHVTTVHNDYPYLRRRDPRSLTKRWFMRLAIRRSKAFVVAVSTIVGERIKSAVSPGTPQRVISNGIVLRKLAPISSQRSALRNALRLPEDAFVFVSAGRLDRQKGYDLLIEAGAGLSKAGEEFCVVILGEGSERAHLKEATNREGLAERFIFVGHSDKVFEYYQAADAYVCSSLYEGGPLVVMESMWAGLPTISTRVGGVPDFVENEVSGLVVPPGDVAALRKAMQRLIREPALSHFLAANGRKSVDKRCDVRKTSAAYLQLYKEMLGN